MGHPLPNWLHTFVRTAWPSLAVAVALYGATISLNISNDFAAPTNDSWIFLWHPIAIDEMNKWVLQNRMVPSFFTALPVVLGFALVVATLSYVVIEKLAQCLRDRVGGKVKPHSRSKPSL